MSGAHALPLWRSMLVLPVNVDRFVDKAHTRGADAILLDLEDAVPLAQKTEARSCIASAVERAGRGGADIGIRVNGELDLLVRDLEAAVRPGVSFLAIPKVRSGVHLQIVSEFVDQLEARHGLPHGSVRFLASIETADALPRAEEIASSSPRLAALSLGSEDFARSCDGEPTFETLLYPKQKIVIAARAAGVMPFGYVGTSADFSDLETFRAVIRRSRKLGFAGGTAIHPDQIGILNEEFGPSSDEIEHARAVLAAAVAAAAEGRGSFAVNGRMVDRPIVDAARRTVALWERIAARS